MRAKQATRARAGEWEDCRPLRRDLSRFTKPKRGPPRLKPGRLKCHTENGIRPSQETHLCFAICGVASPVEPLREPLRPAHLGSFTMAGSDNPFVNADAWRKHPLLNGTWRHIAPGFFIGLTAFGAFYAYDKATQKKAAKH